MLANDTSMGTGWAPLNAFESFVRRAGDHFSGRATSPDRAPWCGTDVKVMGYGDGDRADVVFCVPQNARSSPAGTST